MHTTGQRKTALWPLTGNSPEHGGVPSQRGVGSISAVPGKGPRRRQRNPAGSKEEAWPGGQGAIPGEGCSAHARRLSSCRQQKGRGERQPATELSRDERHHSRGGRRRLGSPLPGRSGEFHRLPSRRRGGTLPRFRTVVVRRRPEKARSSEGCSPPLPPSH